MNLVCENFVAPTSATWGEICHNCEQLTEVNLHFLMHKSFAFEHCCQNNEWGEHRSHCAMQQPNKQNCEKQQTKNLVKHCAMKMASSQEWQSWDTVWWLWSANRLAQHLQCCCALVVLKFVCSVPSCWTLGCEHSKLQCGTFALSSLKCSSPECNVALWSQMHLAEVALNCVPNDQCWVHKSCLVSVGDSACKQFWLFSLSSPSGRTMMANSVSSRHCFPLAFRFPKLGVGFWRTLSPTATGGGRPFATKWTIRGRVTWTFNRDGSTVFWCRACCAIAFSSCLLTFSLLRHCDTTNGGRLANCFLKFSAKRYVETRYQVIV